MLPIVIQQGAVILGLGASLILGGMGVNNMLGLDEANQIIQERNIEMYGHLDEEIEELIEDYKDYEVNYIKWYIDESDITEPLTQEYLNEITSEGLESYIYTHERFNDIVSNSAIEKMRKELPEHIQQNINNRNEAFRSHHIVNNYLRKQIYNDLK